jgi:hypothetical protein
VPRLRSLLVYLLALAIVFTAGVAGGFVYQHEPERDIRTVQLTVDDPDAEVQTIVAGEIVEVGGDFIVIRIDNQEFRLTLPVDAAFDELTRVEDPTTLEGRTVNVGGQQTVSGLILTGIVAIGDSP